MSELVRLRQAIKINVNDFICPCGGRTFTKKPTLKRGGSVFYVCKDCKRKHTHKYMENQIQNEIHRRYLRELRLRCNKIDRDENSGEE